MKNTDSELFSQTSTVKTGVFSLPYHEMKDRVLGKKYVLSLAFVGPARSRSLNRTYREKDKAANVLSFPLDKNGGEIVICPAVVRAQAAAYGYKRSPSGLRAFTAHLFIHGLFHLKGLDHGSTMEKAEKKILHGFNIL